MRFFKFLLLVFFTILGTCFTLTKIQQDVLTAINKNLMIKHCVVLGEHFENKIFTDTFTFVKENTKANISTAFMTTEHLNAIFSRWDEIGAIYQPKTMIFIKTKNLRKIAKYLFRLKNEDILKKFIWVMFFSYDLDLEELDFMYIPYHCQFLLINSIENLNFEIVEIYNTQAFTRERFMTFFGFWQQNGELSVPITDFYQRRINMNETILGVVPNYEPGKCNHPTLCRYEEIVAEFARIMNFRTFYATFQDMEELQKNGSDIILEIYINAFVFDIDYFRPHVVGPIWKSPAFLHIKFLNKYLQGKVEPYRRPFTLKLWQSTAAFIVFGTLAILFIYCHSPVVSRQEEHLIDVLFLCLDSVSNQGGSEPLSTISSRISLLASRFVPFFLVPAYSAAIVSFITVHYLQLPFNDLQELVKDGNFKITYQNGTMAEIFLEKRHDEAAKIAKIKFLAPADQMPQSLDEANNQMCNNSQLSSISFNNDVFQRKRNCTILQIPNPIFTTWDAFMLRQRSPYQTIFNRILKTFSSSGLLKKMGETAYGTKPTFKGNDFFEEGKTPVEMENVLPIFKILATLYFFCFVIFLFEVFYFQIRRKQFLFQNAVIEYFNENIEKINNCL